MRRVGVYLIAVLLISFSNIISAQDKEDRNVRSFSEVRAGEGIEVLLRKGSKEAVTVESDDVSLDRIITDVSGSILKIHLDGNNRGYDIKVYVTFVALEEISASSAADIYSESVIEAEDLVLSVSSAANLEIEIRAKRVEVSASSSGDLQLEGEADELRGNVSSAGDINAYDLRAKRVMMTASSAGSARVYALESIEAKASSAGSIRYRGNPKRTNNSSSSAGSVKKSI